MRILDGSRLIPSVRNKFISMLEQFESMWYGYNGSIKVVQHRIELSKKDYGPIHLVSS